MNDKKFPDKIKKRNGSPAAFKTDKIEAAIQKACMEVTGDLQESKKIAGKVTDKVIKSISKQYTSRETLDVESVQDIIEKALMEQGYYNIAKAYILYREKRGELREVKSALNLKDDLKLSLNSIEVLKKRYLRKNEKREIIETPGELFKRVAGSISRAEDNFKSRVSANQIEEEFYHMIKNREFMPNSPTLMNAGTSLEQLSACFVLPVEDSIEGIFDTLKNMAKIHQSGGGTGFSFSRLRPQGDLVSSTKGEASGPVSFMGIFDKATGVVVQGGRRRGANMGILRCDHPDIIDFIQAKSEEGRLSNFNISVGVTDRFMEAVKKDEDYPLINPRTEEPEGKAGAKTVFDMIVHSAWKSGDPGLIFLDEINRRNPVPKAGKIEATNPCGELPLLPYESCNLGSINLGKMVKKGSIDWEKLAKRVRMGIRFLDNVIEVNRFPLEDIKKMTLANRKVGLGVMGLADMFIKLGIPYNSKEACSTSLKLMKFIRKESVSASMKLAEERGAFPNYAKSIYSREKVKMRNATVNTVAPTGTISIIAGCSSGIEPLFGVSFVRNVLSGTKLFEVNPLFEKIARERDFYSKDILAQISRKGSLQSLKGIPDDVKKVFVTAFDISPRQHLNIQASFQKHTDNSVSKTINLPEDATVEEVREIYLRAYQLGCKGITVYRYGSKQGQVLSFDYRKKKDKPRQAQDSPLTADSEYAGGSICPDCSL
ncbi:MAG: adenosylcobalamin-dependent ribonucleoside-diphosphate reductase [Elusimicrobiota bacterium]